MTRFFLFIFSKSVICDVWSCTLLFYYTYSTKGQTRRAFWTVSVSVSGVLAVAGKKVEEPEGVDVLDWRVDLQTERDRERETTGIMFSVPIMLTSHRGTVKRWRTWRDIRTSEHKGCGHVCYVRGAKLIRSAVCDCTMFLSRVWTHTYTFVACVYSNRPQRSWWWWWWCQWQWRWWQQNLWNLKKTNRPQWQQTAQHNTTFCRLEHAFVSVLYSNNCEWFMCTPSSQEPGGKSSYYIMTIKIPEAPLFNTSIPPDLLTLSVIFLLWCSVMNCVTSCLSVCCVSANTHTHTHSLNTILHRSSAYCRSKVKPGTCLTQGVCVWVWILSYSLRHRKPLSQAPRPPLHWKVLRPQLPGLDSTPTQQRAYAGILSKNVCVSRCVMAVEFFLLVHPSAVTLASSLFTHRYMYGIIFVNKWHIINKGL